MIAMRAVYEFLKRVRDIERVGQTPNASDICQDLFPVEWKQSMVNVLAECKRRGFLDRADLDGTGVAISKAGEQFVENWRG